MHTSRRYTNVPAIVASIAVLAGSPWAAGQTPPPAKPASASGPAAPSTGHPARDTLVRMQRTLNVDFRETPLADAMKFITEVTGADIEAMWTDDRNSTGLDKERLITLKVDKGTALDLLERVLDKATTDATGAGGNTWQMTENGTLQCGPKDRLNKFRRVEIYSVRDLLLELPSYTNAPEFDLQSVLQSSGQGGGGGGQSPFRDNGDEAPTNTRPLNERVDELQSLITELVEPEQWVDNGGDAATIRFFQNTFIVNAPDYVHRQLDGYPYWPQRATRVASVKGRRYVTLSPDAALAGLSGIENQPITRPK